MTDLLEIRAGKTALDHIRKHGLSPSDIRGITGASGAAKWLSIYGLYRVIFSQWLRDLQHPVFLFGTSIGAWTLAAGAQSDPGLAFDRLKTAYIRQVYRGRITPEKITKVSLRILEQVFGPEQVPGILSHPFLRLGFSAVRCQWPMTVENKAALMGGMLAAFGVNLVSGKAQGLFFRRTLFHTPFSDDQTVFPLHLGQSVTDRVTLDQNNFRQALLASGSIPVVMSGIRNIPGAVPGIYRDGGVLDYHPIVSMKAGQKGFILYPHFYSWITPGWFDKQLPWRRASGPVLDRTILLSPSPEFVRQLPCGRIPDRKDFIRFQRRDAERFRIWEEAAKMSRELGNAFLESVESGHIRTLAKGF